jgi:hypothetical protein
MLGGEMMDRQGTETTAKETHMPGIAWALFWAALVTLSIPLAYIIAPSIAALLLWVTDAASRIGWSFPRFGDFSQVIGILIGLSLILGFVQAKLLKAYLPRMRKYLLFTLAGWWLASLAIALIAVLARRVEVSSMVIAAVSLVTAGAIVGALQSIPLQQHIPEGYLWMLINTLAFCSMVLMGSAADSILELVVFLCLPGLISGFGMRILLTRSAGLLESPESLADRQTADLITRWRWILIPAALVGFFVLATWGYAKGQLAVAKARGVYPTPEQAIIGRFGEGWGGANVVNIENVHAGPNDPDGSQPHIWFGGADVYLDRVPEGGRRTHYVTGSFYVQIKDGWVYMPEGAFPPYVGWVMSLYGLEGVNS